MKLFLMLDYDGTLVPLQDRPGEAVPPEKLLRLLQGIAHREDTRVAVVSGRSMNDLKELLPLTGCLYLVGCHGGVISEPPGGEYYTFSREINMDCLEELYRLLAEEIKIKPGFILEKKEVSLALHYRMAGASDVESVKDKFMEHFRRTCSEAWWECLCGKRVWEVRPREVNKGKACLYLLDKWPGATCVYAGDDITDEDAFKSLRERGETVLVGEQWRPTWAERILKREELGELLYKIYYHGPGAILGDEQG